MLMDLVAGLAVVFAVSAACVLEAVIRSEGHASCGIEGLTALQATDDATISSANAGRVVAIW